MKTRKTSLIEFPFKQAKNPINDLMNSEKIRTLFLKQLEANLIKVTA